MHTTHMQSALQIASSLVQSMTGELVLNSTRMKTGDQNFVYTVKTSDAEYVLQYD